MNKALNNTAVNNSAHRKLFQTADGSWTIHIPEVGETYHSRHGAIQESMHVFINSGLNHCSVNPIRILEVGLGTGLNVILTYLNTQKSIFYHGIEPFPIDKQLVDELILTSESYAQLYRYIHFSSENVEIFLADSFALSKHFVNLKSFKTEESFDVIYYDAFGPQVDPSLWTMDALQKCYDLLNPGGIWVSYCAKGEVRRNLIQAGFEVERLPGPPGKREMLRAIKK